MSPPLALFIAVVLVFGFVFSTAMLVISLGNRGAVPKSVLSFLRRAAGGQELVAEGQKWWVVILFGGMSIAIINLQSSYLDASRARRVLGWEPRISFAAGIERTVEWFRAATTGTRTER